MALNGRAETAGFFVLTVKSLNSSAYEFVCVCLCECMCVHAYTVTVVEDCNIHWIVTTIIHQFLIIVCVCVCVCVCACVKIDKINFKHENVLYN